MEPLAIRTLTQVETLVFGQTEADVAVLLRLLADYCENSGGTFLGATFNNDFEGGTYSERLTAFVECPYQA